MLIEHMDEPIQYPVFYSEVGIEFKIVTKNVK